jgi:hypothetical protein
MGEYGVQWLIQATEEYSMLVSMLLYLVQIVGLITLVCIIRSIVVNYVPDRRPRPKIKVM